MVDLNTLLNALKNVASQKEVCSPKIIKTLKGKLWTALVSGEIIVCPILTDSGHQKAYFKTGDVVVRQDSTADTFTNELATWLLTQPEDVGTRALMAVTALSADVDDYAQLASTETNSEENSRLKSPRYAILVKCMRNDFIPPRDDEIRDWLANGVRLSLNQWCQYQADDG